MAEKGEKYRLQSEIPGCVGHGLCTWTLVQNMTKM
jgi:hypothetical protein